MLTRGALACQFHILKIMSLQIKFTIFFNWWLLEFGKLQEKKPTTDLCWSNLLWVTLLRNYAISLHFNIFPKRVLCRLLSALNCSLCRAKYWDSASKQGSEVSKQHQSCCHGVSRLAGVHSELQTWLKRKTQQNMRCQRDWLQISFGKRDRILMTWGQH